MIWKFNDGGRKAAGYKSKTDDCVVRAIAIGTGMSYQEVYDLVNTYGAKEYKTKQRKGKSSAREGVYKSTVRRILEELGWGFTPTMFIGSGCKVHLKADELPSGNIICTVSKHVVAVKDGVIQDTHDCSRNDTRCVYGYWEDRK